LASASLFAQGSLTPPSGPAPSMKTLGQIEPRTAIEKLPYKISASGAYYLAANLSVPAGVNGISVDASNVTLDLNGFTLRGAALSEAAISIVPGKADVTIYNGAITAAGAGVEGSAAVRVRVEGVRVSNCTGSGISLGAEGSVNHCDAHENGTTGIRVGLSGTILNSRAHANGANGIETDQKSTVRESAAARNAFAGISAADYSKVMNSIATDNNANGINAGAGVHITDCTASANKQSGINGGQLCLVTRASACWNAQGGVVVQDSSSVIDSSTSGNGWIGIATGSYAQVTNSKADANAGGGIFVQRGSTVRDCSVQRNSNDGIVLTDQCTISRNSASNNSNLKGVAGIHAKGTDNVLQENNLVANDRGLALDSEGNLVVKNTATNNSLNFYVVGDQTMAPVITTFENGEANPMSNIAF
ncbi:MAG TPA: hypothetical protein VK633_07750, partial [Verrucomicrobiae bacterium]|nr:hypothetical protein [Verrucomicrobiae bacterium]